VPAVQEHLSTDRLSVARMMMIVVVVFARHDLVPVPHFDVESNIPKLPVPKMAKWYIHHESLCIATLPNSSPFKCLLGPLPLLQLFPSPSFELLWSTLSGIYHSQGKLALGNTER